jgi:tetratricopeptide (TPR) repeat protein
MEGPVVAEGGTKALGFSQFEDNLSTLIGIGVEQPLGSKQSDSPKRKHYLARRDELLALARTGRITVQERVNLSAYLIRLRQYEAAVQVLQPVAAQERQNFMLFANLATAHQLLGGLERAVAYLQQVKDLWPKAWPGLTKEQLDWLRTAEKYHLELVKLRYREASPAGRASVREKLDDLFREKGSVRFVAESGRYEAGKLAAAERAKLPADALAVVQQLVLWLPDDTRLYWLLGELYNANGDIEASAKIFDDCIGNVRRFSASDLRAHRVVVQEAKPGNPLLEVAAAPAENAPTPGLLPSWLPDSRQLVAVGGIAAVVIVLLGYFQIREMRRRRRDDKMTG